MSWMNSPNGRSIMVLAGVALAALVLVAGLQMTDLRPPLGVRLGIAVALIVAGVWAACRYWRHVDEAGRAAQKWAWFWGGSFGLVLGEILLGLMAAGRLDLMPADLRPNLLPAYGGAVMVAAQMTGFLVAWAWWWARRR